MSETKAHLEELQSRWLNVKRGLAQSMSNALDDVVNSVFASQSLIGYELIQNADDAAKEEGLSVEVDFFILQDYLLIRHNGAHFTPADVKALCQYGARTYEEESENSAKQRDLKKTGYKGIGFKSVFSISDEVSIFSDKYNFKFDKSACPQAYPWQIIPYATSVDKVPENIQNYIEKDKVIFLIKIKPEISREKLKNKLRTIFANYKTILFLRHTSSLELFYEYVDGIQSVRRLSRKIEDGVYHLETADKDKVPSFTRWKIDKFKFDVPEEVRQSVKKIDKKVCPNKLKEATNLELSFAAKLKEDFTVIPLTGEESYIFSYLPTKSRNDFPFVVNGNFLLNPARTKVLENRWNEFLFEQIGYFQFEWFKGMAKDEKFKYEFARLIKKYADSATGLNGALNRGVKKAQQSIAFIPVIESSELKKSPETIVDKTQISTAHQETDFVKKSFNNTTYEIADPQIKKINELIRVGANEFNIETLKDTIRQTNKFKTPETNAKLIDFFYKRINEIEGAEKSDWNKVLEDTTFVLDKEKNLKEPKELYFPQEVQLPFMLDMAFVHELVFNQTIAPNEALQNWINRLGLAAPNPIEIIRRGIYQLLEEEKVTHDNVIAITQYIYNNQTDLIKKDYEFLGKKLPIMTNENQLKQAGVCHLSSNYHPKLPLEEYLSEEDIFVNNVYLSESTAESNVLESDEVTAENTLAFQEIEGWNRFFSRLGVKQEMELDLNENSWNLTKQEFKNHFRDFTNYLNTNKYLPKYNPNNSHSLFTWLKPHYIEHTLNNHEFAIAYWQILLEPKKWQELQSKSKRSTFSHSGGQVKIPSNFNFIVETNPHFPAIDENCYPTIELYSHSLKDIVEDWRPVAYFDIPPDKEAFLNIKSTLSIEDCLEILALMETTNEPNKEKITKIYSYLIDNRISKEELIASTLFSDTFKLLAVNNSFQPKADLKYLNLPRFAEKVDAPHFLYTGLPEDKATLFCDLMDISTIQLDDLVLVKEHQKEVACFSKKWLTLLPLIALVSADQRGNSYNEELSRLQDLAQQTEFTAYDSLSLTYTDEDKVEIYRKGVKAWVKDHQIFYTSPWQDKLTKYELLQILAKYFDLQQVEKEVSLLMELDLNEAIAWLENQGYDNSLLEDFEFEDIETPIEPDNGNPVTGQSEENLKDEVSEPSIGYSTESSSEETNPLGGKGIFIDDIDPDDVKDLNLISLESALKYLESKGYHVAKATKNLEDSHTLSQLYPVYAPDKAQNSKNALTVMCRSAKNGLLYLRTASWNRLKQEDVILYVLEGNSYLKSSLFTTRDEVITDMDADFQPLRIEAVNDADRIDEMLEKGTDSEDIWMIIRRQYKEEYQSIFEDIQEKEKGDNMDDISTDNEDLD